MPMSLDERENWGRLTERLDVLVKRLETLESDISDRSRRRSQVSLTWQTTLVLAIATLIAGALGGVIAVVLA
jgi:hypothetical protein